MNANKMLNDARKAEREGNDEKAEELYRAIIDSFPDSNATNTAKLDLNELLVRMGKPSQLFATQPIVDDVLTDTTATHLSKSKPIVNKVHPVNAKTIESVAVIDIKIPFWSMVTLMVTASIAVIPAFIILAIISAGMYSIFLILMKY
jgi:hypothetical protein